MDFETLPSGQRFAFWDDRTRYARVYHVAQQNAAADDRNTGTLKRLFRTIGPRRRVLQPGRESDRARRDLPRVRPAGAAERERTR